jgi:hypothetical protein
MSEMKRAAASLVERRTERFASRHDLAQSKSRLEVALERARIARPWPFIASWSEEAGVVMLETIHEPSRGARRFLELASLAFVVLVGSSAWALMKAEESALRFLLPMITVLAVLGFPIVTLAVASQRAALDSRIRKAIRVALVDEDEAFPPPQRWADEER